MAVDRIWTRTRRGLYIDLLDNVVFRDYPPIPKTLHKFGIKKTARKSPSAKALDSRPPQGNVNFPDLSRYIEIDNRPGYGRFVRARTDLSFEAKIADCKAFAAVIDRTEGAYCVSCLGEIPSNIRNPINCLECDRVRYCSRTCRTDNRTHMYECGTAFHSFHFGEVDLVKKLVMQMVFKALALHDGNVQELVTRVEGIVAGGLNEMPQQLTNDLEQFQCIMCLHTIVSPGFYRQFYETYGLIMQLPQIRRIFNTTAEKRFFILQSLYTKMVKTFKFNSESLIFFYIIDSYNT